MISFFSLPLENASIEEITIYNQNNSRYTVHITTTVLYSTLVHIHFVLIICLQPCLRLNNSTTQYFCIFSNCLPDIVFYCKTKSYIYIV